MSHSEITFITKIEDGGTTAAGLVSAADLNEIKDVVNGNGSNVDGRLDVVEGYVDQQISYLSVSANATISARVTLVDLDNNDVTLTLPVASSVANMSFVVKRSSNGDHVLTVTSPSLIDGVSNDIVIGIIHESITFYSNGTDYLITSRDTAAYASISLVTPADFASTSTPVKLNTWDTNVISTAGRMTADQANRNVDVIYFSGDAFDRLKISGEVGVILPTNIICTVQAYYDASPIGQPFSVAGLGAGKPITIPVTAIYSATGVGSVSLYMSTDGISTTTVTVNHASLYVESLSD